MVAAFPLIDVSGPPHARGRQYGEQAALGTPWSVCRPPRAGIGGGMTASVAMVVMQPALGVMEVAPLPALNRMFTRYSLQRTAVRSAAE